MSESDLDFALALSLQDQCDRHNYPNRDLKKGIVDEHWELNDPTPNIHDLFVKFDAQFFWGKLSSSGVAVAWSGRMTL